MSAVSVQRQRREAESTGSRVTRKRNSVLILCIVAARRVSARTRWTSRTRPVATSRDDSEEARRRRRLEVPRYSRGLPRMRHPSSSPAVVFFFFFTCLKAFCSTPQFRRSLDTEWLMRGCKSYRSCFESSLDRISGLLHRVSTRACSLPSCSEPVYTVLSYLKNLQLSAHRFGI